MPAEEDEDSTAGQWELVDEEGRTADIPECHDHIEPRQDSRTSVNERRGFVSTDDVRHFQHRTAACIQTVCKHLREIVVSLFLRLCGWERMVEDDSSDTPYLPAQEYAQRYPREEIIDTMQPQVSDHQQQGAQDQEQEIGEDELEELGMENYEQIELESGIFYMESDENVEKV